MSSLAKVVCSYRRLTGEKAAFRKANNLAEVKLLNLILKI
jgi:hypothetical protein